MNDQAVNWDITDQLPEEEEDTGGDLVPAENNWW